MNAIKDALLGLAIGDALGVPVEFRDRSSIQRNPVTDMRGYGTYNVPAAEDIYSSGYVVHKASIWCLLTTGTYKDAVLKAVNLGEDTDTTGAVTGGLAGLLYSHENIPAAWFDLLARRTDIEDLAERVAAKLYTNEKPN